MFGECGFLEFSFCAFEGFLGVWVYMVLGLQSVCVEVSVFGMFVRQKMIFGISYLWEIMRVCGNVGTRSVCIWKRLVNVDIWFVVCVCIYGCVWWVGGSPHVFLWLPLCQCVWACARWLCSFFGPFRLKAWPGLWSSVPLPFLRGAPVQCNFATDEWKLNLICSLHRVKHPRITWIYSLSCHSRCFVFLSFAKHKRRNFQECSQSYVLLQLAFKIKDIIKLL